MNQSTGSYTYNSMADPQKILDTALKRASANISHPVVSDPDTLARVNSVCRDKSNRACVRLLMAALLAKIHKPEVDIRKPYTPESKDHAIDLTLPLAQYL